MAKINETIRWLFEWSEYLAYKLGLVFYFSKPDPPAAPDYAGAATAQGQANLDAARASAKLSNPNITNQYGTREVTFSDDDRAFINDQLSPLGQQLFDIDNAIKLRYGQIGQEGLDSVSNAFSQPFDMSKVQGYSVTPDVAGTEQVTQALIDRNQPFLDRNREQTENNLMIQGHNRGGEAWNAKQDDLGRQENDARLAAILAGGQEQSRLAGLESSRRGQDIQEQAYLRNLPLSEVNALRTGAQPGQPQFQNYQGTNVQAAPLFDAALAGGNFAQQNYQNQLASSGGIFDLAGAGLGAAGAAGGWGNLFSW